MTKPTSISPAAAAATVGVFFGYIFGLFACIPSNHSLVFASPNSTIIAVTNAWKEPLVGGQPIRPFHLGSVNPRMDVGRSEGDTPFFVE